MVLIPTIAAKVSIPIVGAGGFCNGHGLAAALALGAEGISMGTRFALSTESPLHDYYKQLSLESTEEDTFITDRWDGLPGRLLSTEAARQLARRSLPGIESATSTLRIKRELGLSWYELVAGTLRMKEVEQLSLGKMVAIPVGFSMLKRAVFDGDEDGIMLTGQNAGMIKTVLSCQEIVDQTIGEAETILRNLQSVTTARGA
jgi:enoyl-[acyl-carrier protein] reductase II